MFLGVAQFGSVLEWGSRGRGFKSSHPDQYRIVNQDGSFFIRIILEKLNFNTNLSLN